MRDAPRVWFLVADRTSARLLDRSVGAAGQWRVDEKARLVLTTTTEAPHRPPPVGLLAPAVAGHDPDGRLGHFARLLCGWLPKLLAQHRIEVCRLFAPADLLAEFRRAAPADLASALVLEDCELGELTSVRLAEHPRVAALQPA